MLELLGISKSYSNTPVLTGATLCCSAGEITCLAGSNAAGKTTLLTIAAGAQKADAGQVRCNGDIGYLPQENALLEELTVRENLALWYAAAKLPRGAILAPSSTEAALGLLPFAKKRTCKLSGGMKKRLAIACALVCDPACLLLDEPFTALDLASKTDIISLLHRLKDQGKTLLFSSHDPAAIAAVADRIAILQAGSIRSVVSLDSSQKQNAELVLQILSQC